MSARMAPETLAVVRGVIGSMNAQLRAAGRGEHQLVVTASGGTRFATPEVRSRSMASSAATAARTGATSSAPTGTPSAAASAPRIERAVGGPQGRFELAWSAVAGASAYKVWVDDQAIGLVPQPSFAGSLAAGRDTATIRVQAQLADGSFSAPTAALRVTRRPDQSAQVTAAPSS
jgi:hypothetical protein